MPIKTASDVRRVEQTPLEQQLTLKNTYEIFVDNAQRYPDKVALRFLETGEPGGPNVTWTYHELLQGIHRTANLLHELGVGPTDAIAVLLPGCLEYHLALWGGEAAGIASPLNPLLSEAMLIELMEAAGAKVLIAYGGAGDSDYWQKAMNIHSRVSSLEAVLRVKPIGETAPSTSELPAGVLDFNEEIARQVSDRLISGRQISPDDIAAYFHTGGTTGAPKMAKHSHGGQVFSAWSYSTMQNMRASDCVIGGFPMFHTAGVLPGALSSLFVGLELVIPTTTLMRNKDVVRNYWQLSAYHRVTSISGAPTILSALTSIPLNGADLSTVKGCRTGTAAIPAELSERFQRLFGVLIQESYGMTEMTGLSSITPPGVKVAPGCAGITIPFGRYKLMMMDEDGVPSDREVAPGDVGMILYKGPNSFPGYLDPDATRKTFTADGWLITGDLGYIDDADMLHVTGRAKDLIIRSGHNIDPKMIEDAISRHPDVVLCAAVGAPDAYAGELPVVFVTLVAGARATAEELLAFAADTVHEAPARPKSITILEEMPLTNVAKIFKPALRLLAAETTVQAQARRVAGELGGEQPTLSASAQLDERGRIVVKLRVVEAGELLLARLTSELAKLPVQVTIVR